MKTKKFVYTGRENLEAMQEAKNYNRFLIDFIKRNTRRSGARILDFGAGVGTYADLLKTEGFVVECLEPDEEQAKELKSKGYKVTASSNNLTPNTYDVIYALNVFEHIEDDRGIMAELTNALKKKGKLIVYVPAFQLLFTSMDKRVGHFRRYKKGRLKIHAKSAGLKIRELYYCDPLGFFVALAFKYVGNQDGVVSPGSVKIYDKFIFPFSKMLHPLLKNFIGKNAVLIAEK